MAAVKAGNIIPVYGEQYIRPGLKYPYETIASYYPYPGYYPYGVQQPLAGVPVAPTGVAPVAPAATTGPAGPMAAGAPGGSVIFTGTGSFLKLS